MSITEQSLHRFNVEVRVVNQTDGIPPRVRDASGDNAASDVVGGFDHLGAEADEALYFRRDVFDAPIGRRPVGSRRTVRDEPELKPANVKADVERLLEIGRETEHLRIPIL